jgi:lysophospholipase L1-like esterase
MGARPGTIQAWGNSLTLGLGSSTGNDYPSVLARLFGTTTVGNSGIGGETSIQITNRITLNFNRRGYGNILEMGRNNPTATDQIMADLNTSTRRLGGHCLYLGVLKGKAAIDGGGDSQAVFDAIDDVNNRMRVKYRERFLDLNALLVAAGGPLGPFPDATAFAHGYPPPGIRYDNLHPNDAGYNIMAHGVFDLWESVYGPEMPIGFCPFGTV